MHVTISQILDCVLLEHACLDERLLNRTVMVASPHRGRCSESYLLIFDGFATPEMVPNFQECGQLTALPHNRREYLATTDRVVIRRHQVKYSMAASQEPPPPPPALSTPPSSHLPLRTLERSPSITRSSCIMYSTSFTDCSSGDQHAEPNMNLNNDVPIYVHDLVRLLVATSTSTNALHYSRR
ncbi:hypothetical protein CHS0354_002507 [Potamilus streckersoni]|uniref:Uncharacterized protein n=1 Tax=Potamilus streckersoni TaxID=2493646 RepID=A0AAE0W1L4_9BIVA|nr:hypothetical protein CHS0354_002507 [Potamilus streckersoni]